MTTNEDTAIISTVSTTDIEENILAYSLLVSPTNGTAAVNLDGTFTYMPNLNFFVGTDSVVVSVTNSAGVTSIATITFIVQRGISFRCSIIL
ncbi:Ig-like domain-containing protein [Priestia flexa]|uniref:Ig-like domain-containing protein n=1 Tax=Priestia flexa TaxID=86664 RepID=UPI003AAF8197